MEPQFLLHHPNTDSDSMEWWTGMDWNRGMEWWNGKLHYISFCGHKDHINLKPVLLSQCFEHMAWPDRHTTTQKWFILPMFNVLQNCRCDFLIGSYPQAVSHNPSFGDSRQQNIR